MRNVNTLRAEAVAVEGILLLVMISALVLIFVPSLGVKINAALQPLQAVLGK